MCRHHPKAFACYCRGGGNAETTTVMVRPRSEILPWTHAATYLSSLLLASSLLAFGQTAAQALHPPINLGSRPRAAFSHREFSASRTQTGTRCGHYRIVEDTCGPTHTTGSGSSDLVASRRARGFQYSLLRLKFGATYTFLNQYATSPPDGIRHDQLSGRLDFTGAWSVYDHESTAGSISLLIRSGTNIGISQQFNLSDRLGSGLYLNCLQGGGPQRPTTVTSCIGGRISSTKGFRFM